MTEFAAPKFICVAAAGIAMLALSGCDRAGGVLSQTLQEIKTVPVDANDHSSGIASDRKIGKKDVALLVNTAKELAVGQDGVLTHTDAVKKLQFAVLDAVDMPRDGDDKLDERLHNVKPDPNAALAQAAHDLPDIPVHDAEAPESPMPRAGVDDHPWHPVAVVAAADVRPAAADDDDAAKPEMVKSDLHRSIQIGSFGTMAAAQNALVALRDDHPVAAKYTPSYQKVTTPAGKPLVRLKLGPVHNDVQAQKLCDQLDIHDIWCHKAG